jgi:hypothetical protein
MAQEKKIIRKTRYETPEGKVTVIVVYDDFSSAEIKEEPAKASK